MIRVVINCGVMVHEKGNEGQGIRIMKKERGSDVGNVVTTNREMEGV